MIFLYWLNLQPSCGPRISDNTIQSIDVKYTMALFKPQNECIELNSNDEFSILVHSTSEYLF